MRKLASIQQVHSIQPIPGADAIEQASVQGWNVVVKKGEFKEGDLCVFFEVDSLLPEQPWAEFMRPRGFRVKTVKLRGVLSQGLALPMDAIFPGRDAETESAPNEGDDVTDQVGVRKYERPQESTGGGSSALSGPFPSLVPKTDEPRVQSSQGVLEELRGQPYVITLKMDGSSATFTYDEDGRFCVCSRNGQQPDEEGNRFWAMARKYDLEEKLKGTTLAVQGELCSPGIQRNLLNLSEPDLYVFNIFDWQRGRYLSHDQVKTVAGVVLNLRLVPVEEEGESFDYDLPTLLKKAEGFYPGTKNHREGLVVRSRYESKSQVLRGRMSFKAINNSYLLDEK